MPRTKNIFISDVHIGAEEKVGAEGEKNKYNWQNENEIKAFADFLEYICGSEGNNIKNVVLLGDIFDTWTCPIEYVPPNFHDILNYSKIELFFNKISD